MWYKLAPILRANNTSAGIAFLKGSLANTIRVKAAASIVPPNSKPDNIAIIGIHMPTSIPAAPMSSKAPVKTLKKAGKPNRLNSSAIFPEIIFDPVTKKKTANIICRISMKIVITSF